MNISSILSQTHNFETIKKDSERTVSKLSVGDKHFLIKENLIKSPQKIIKSTLKIKRWNGYPGLLNEFENIKKARLITNNIPKVFAFHIERSKINLDKKHYLITEFISDAQTSEAHLKDSKKDKEKLMLKITSSFRESLDSGFMHLDPHPGNIMLDDDFKKLWFIDLEYCDFNIYNRDIAYGFLCGHYYHYYANNFIDNKTYDSIIKNTIMPTLDISNIKLFNNIYRLYKDNYVKRRDRFSHFLSKEMSDCLVSKYS